MPATLKPRNVKSKPGRKVPAAKPAHISSPQRKRWFRFFALAVVPLLVLGALEIVLRIAGYGHPTGFFEKIRLGDKDFLVSNEHFSQRFFPPQLMRWPGPVMFPARKPADTFRIFILGESAARGEPEPNYAASRYLHVLLSEKFPATKFEVINLGITAINSHVILPIARDAARAEGDLWIIYMGNNEMVGPFGAATVFGAKAPPASLVRLNLALQQLRVGQLLVNLSRHLHGNQANAAWGGMKMFLGNQLRAEDPRRETVYRNFARNLDDIVQAGLGSGAKILLNTVAVNLKDCPPFASLTNANLSATDMAEFGKLFSAGVPLQTQGDVAGAEKLFLAAEKLDANHPELQFRRAQCLAQTGGAAAAREHFQKACDVDALPFRADSRINGAIAAAGQKFAGGRLVFFDAAAALAARTADGVCGQDFFYEHVHFNFDGEFELGRAWAAEVDKLLPPEIVRGAVTNGWASSAACAARLGLTDWNRCAVTEMVIDRLHRPPLSSQLNNGERMQALRDEEKNLRRQMDTNALAAAARIYFEAIRRSPADWLLHENFAEFLETTGDSKQALAEWQRFRELLPHASEGHYQAGRLLGALNQWNDSEAALLQALTLRPQLVEARYELGNTHLGAEKFTAALADFQAAAKLNPADAMYVAMQGKAVAKLNLHAEATVLYQRALQMDAGLWEVAFALGDELAALNQFAEAAQAYAEVLRARPDNALAHLDLGVMQARLSRMDEAVKEFEAVLKLEPGNQQAADYLQRVQRWKPGQK